MKTLLKTIAAAGVLTLSLTQLSAEEIKAGDLTIENPVMRATPPNAQVAGGYMTIHNAGSEPDRLTGGSADFASKVEVHEMKMDGEVMRMRQVGDGLEIPAGGEVVLKPGGYHLMFMGLEERMEDGETRPATLTFEKAGDVQVDFPVKDMR